MSNMELWYTENQTNNVNFSMKVKSHLYSKQSDFQKMESSSMDHLGHRISVREIHSIRSSIPERNHQWCLTVRTHYVYCET